MKTFINLAKINATPGLRLAAHHGTLGENGAAFVYARVRLSGKDGSRLFCEVRADGRTGTQIANNLFRNIRHGYRTWIKQGVIHGADR